MDKMTAEQVQTAMKGAPDWTITNGLTRRFHLVLTDPPNVTR